MRYTNREGNPVTLANLVAEMEASTGTDFSSVAVQRQIWLAINRLPMPERDLLNRIYFREEVRRSDAEIASELGVEGPELSRMRRSVMNKLIRSISF